MLLRRLALLLTLVAPSVASAQSLLLRPNFMPNSAASGFFIIVTGHLSVSDGQTLTFALSNATWGAGALTVGAGVTGSLSITASSTTGFTVTCSHPTSTCDIP